MRTPELIEIVSASLKSQSIKTKGFSVETRKPLIIPAYSEAATFVSTASIRFTTLAKSDNGRIEDTQMTVDNLNVYIFVVERYEIVDRASVYIKNENGTIFHANISDPDPISIKHSLAEASIDIKSQYINV